MSAVQINHSGPVPEHRNSRTSVYGSEAMIDDEAWKHFALLLVRWLSAQAKSIAVCSPKTAMHCS